MSENIYEAPESDVALDDGVSKEFYVVSPAKYAILYISTLGLYKYYWFYKNWSMYEMSSGVRIRPTMRAIFSIFFTHSLFRLFDAKSKEIDSSYVWSPGGIATIYVLFLIVESLCDGLSSKSIGSPITDIMSLLVFPIIGWTLYKAQFSANIACNDPGGKKNSQLSAVNFIWIFVGAILWLLVGVAVYDAVVGLPEFS